MNIKRFIYATLALFIFISLYEWLVNGIFMSGMYQETAGIWRNMSDMEANMPLAICFQLAIATWLAFSFSQLYKDGGIANGLLFGLFFGIFGGLLMAYWYVWLPVPSKLGWSWLTSGITEGIAGGLILGSIYHK